MTLARTRVAIVVPTYNEAENLPALVQQLQDARIDGLGFVIVDDGSPDGTGDVAEGLAAKSDGYFEVVHRTKKEGLGRAYVAGFRRALDAGASFIVQMDADFSHPPEVVSPMLARLDAADVVVGSRYASGGGIDPAWSRARRLLSATGNLGIRVILSLAVRDATSGFKAFRRAALETVDPGRLHLAGFGFQSEVAYRCQEGGLRVIEHPYVFRERRAGRSKMSGYIVSEALCRLILLRLRS